MLRFAITIYSLLCLAGCKTSGELGRIPAGEVGPANSTDATLVTDATAYLRERMAQQRFLEYSVALSSRGRSRTKQPDWLPCCWKAAGET